MSFGVFNFHTETADPTNFLVALHPNTNESSTSD